MYSLILLATSAFAVFAKPCDDGWRYFPGTNSCYKLLNDNITWTLAEFKCLFQGAHHVAIESAEENQFVHELAKHSEIWTGAAFFGKNPVYVNSNQAPYGNFTNWLSGVTPPMNRARRCIKMDQAGFWFQSCCKKKTFAVCEKPAAYKVSFDKTTVEQNNFRRVKFFRHV